MAPNGDDTSQSSSIFTLFAESWSLIATFAVAFIGIVFFLIGLIGILSGSDYYNNIMFVVVGMILLSLSLLLSLYCRISVKTFVRRLRQHLLALTRSVTNLASNRQQRHCAAQPSGRRQSLPVPNVDENDGRFIPSPAYAETLQSVRTFVRLLRQHLSALTRTLTDLASTRRQRHCATQPSGRRQSLPISSVDANDGRFTPPPTYAEALQSGFRLTSVHNPELRPPPYTWM